VEFVVGAELVVVRGLKASNRLATRNTNEKLGRIVIMKFAIIFNGRTRYDLTLIPGALWATSRPLGWLIHKLTHLSTACKHLFHHFIHINDIFHYFLFIPDKKKTRRGFLRVRGTAMLELSC
jgi:hypothetical protein